MQIDYLTMAINFDKVVIIAIFKASDISLYSQFVKNSSRKIKFILSEKIKKLEYIFEKYNFYFFVLALKCKLICASDASFTIAYDGLVFDRLFELLLL